MLSSNPRHSAQIHHARPEALTAPFERGNVIEKLNKKEEREKYMMRRQNRRRY